MQVKITDVLETKPPFKMSNGGTSYSWVVNCVLKDDGGVITNINNEFISTYSPRIKDRFKIGEVFNVEGKRSKTGNQYLKIIDTKPKEETGVKDVKKMPIEVFDQLVKHCWNLTDLTPGCVNEAALCVHDRVNLFVKILGCASVMLDENSLTDNMLEETNEDKVKKVFDVSDDDIPF